VTALERPNRKVDRLLSVFWSQPDENRGWPLVILYSDRIIQIACSEADNQTGGVVQNAGELNSF